MNLSFVNVSVGFGATVKNIKSDDKMNRGDLAEGGIRRPKFNCDLPIMPGYCTNI